MNLPLFSVQDDPGPDFNRLLASSEVRPAPIDGALDPHDYRHGTTWAIRFADGVLLAGDRRATSQPDQPPHARKRSSRPTGTAVSSRAPPGRQSRW